MTTYTRSKLLLPAAFVLLGLILSGRPACAALTATITYTQASSTTATLTASVTGGAAGDHYTYAFSNTAGPGAVGNLPFTTASMTATSGVTRGITVSVPSAAANDYRFQVIVTDKTAGTSDTKTTAATVEAPTVALQAGNVLIGTQAGHNTTTVTASLKNQFGTALSYSDSEAVMWSVKNSPAGASVSPASGTVTNAATTATTLTATAAGSYIVLATTSLGVVDSTSITADAPPTVTSLVAAVNSNGTSGTLTTTASTTIPSPGNTLTYAYSKTSGPAATITGSGATATDTYSALGTYTFQVTVTDSLGQTTNATSNNVTVSPVLTTITVTPTSSTINIAGTEMLTAAGYDQFHMVLATQPTFTWMVTAPVSGGGTVDGMGNFTAPHFITGSTTQADTVQAKSGTVMNTATVTVDDVVPTLTTAAAANPVPVIGTTTNLSVLGGYTGGENHLIYSWATTGPATVTYSDNNDNSAKNCTATFTQAGSYTFTVTIADPSGNSITSMIAVTVLQTFTSVMVTSPDAMVTVGQQDRFTATADDQFGKALSPQPTFTYSLPLGTGTVDSQTGLFTAPNTLPMGMTSETDTVEATNGSMSGTASVTVTDAPITIAQPAKANGVSGTYPASGTFSGTSVALTVFGGYTGGESQLHYTWSASPASGVMPFPATNGTNAGKDLTATFTQVGTYTFTCTIVDPLAPSVMAQMSSVIVVVSQGLTSITISPTSPTVTVGNTDQVTAIGLDQFGMTLVMQPAFTYSVTAGNGTIDSAHGKFTAPSRLTGSQEIDSVDAASGTVVSPTTSITVTDSAITIAQQAEANGTSGSYTTTGTSVSLSVLGGYLVGGNNEETELTYTWSSTGPASVTFGTPASGGNPAVVNGTNAAKNITATFTQIGTYTFTCTISDPSNGSIMTSVMVTVNPAFTSITLSPATPTVPITDTDKFTAIGLDQFGASLAPQPTFTYSLTAGNGTVNSASGLFTAPTPMLSTFITLPETDTVQAKSGAITKTADVVVDDVRPTIATVAEANLTPISVTTTDASVALSALGAYHGGASNLKYTWSYTGPTGVTFSPNATNAAQNSMATFTQAGVYTFTVLISDPSYTTATASASSITSTVTVFVNLILTTISVSGQPLPGTTTVPSGTPVPIKVGGMIQFKASGLDQFGVTLTPQPTFTWTIATDTHGNPIGTGTISPVTGLFTAPNTLPAGMASETDTVNATNGSIVGTDNAIVTDAGPTVTTPVATPSPVTGTTTILSAVGAYAGGEPNLKYTWSSTGPAGVTFGTPATGTNPAVVNGTNAAQSITATFMQAGTYNFTVTVTDPSGGSVHSDVKVTVDQTPTKVTVNAASPTVAIGATDTFTAKVTDQFGAIIASPLVTWTATGGTVTSPGITTTYTASTTSGQFKGTATAAVAQGSAAVTILADPAVSFTVVANPATAAAGMTPIGVTVTALDRYKNIATGYVGTVHFTTSDLALSQGVQLPLNYTFTSGSGSQFDNGVHTFNVVLITPGNQTVTATDTASSSITGTSNPITVTGLLGLGVTQSPLAVGDPTFTSFTISGSSMFKPTGTTSAFDQTLVLAYEGMYDPTLLPLVLGDVTVDSSTLLTVDNVPVTTDTTDSAIPYAGPYNVAVTDNLPADTGGMTFRFIKSTGGLAYQTITQSGTVVATTQVPILGMQTLQVDPLPSHTDSTRTNSGPFSEGLHMVSVPFDYSSDAASATDPTPITDVFKLLDFSDTYPVYLPAVPTFDAVGPALRFAVWDPTQGNYLITGDKADDANFVDPNSLLIGHGYWVRFPDPTKVTGTPDAEPGLISRGTAATDSSLISKKVAPPGDQLLTGYVLDSGYVQSTGQFAIPLNTGWNLIGDPFENSVQLSNFQVAVSYPSMGGPSKTGIVNADTLGFVSDVLYTYNLLGDGKYDPITPGGSGLSGVLAPYSGYWILAFQPCTLYVSSN